MAAVVVEGRYEMKYLLPLDRRAALLDDAAAFIQPDPHGDDLSLALPEVVADAGSPPRGYRVSSLYLDDTNLTGYARRIDGRRIRNRMRIRTYGDPGSPSPVFLEAKRKLHKQVIKHRVACGTTEHWARWSGPRPWDEAPLPVAPLDRERQQRWCATAQDKQLAPVCRVEYWRETFARGQLRLTLDHRVGAVATHDPHALRGPCPTRLIPEGWIILELKYNGQAPPWMRRLVARHRLIAEPISKFALGVGLTLRPYAKAERAANTPPTLQRAWREPRAAK